MINDQYTNLKVSRQRKWQLRHPAEQKEIRQRFWLSEKGKKYNREQLKQYHQTLESRIYNREYQRDLNYYLRRYLNARSYQDERRSYWNIA